VRFRSVSRNIDISDDKKYKTCSTILHIKTGRINSSAIYVRNSKLKNWKKKKQGRDEYSSPNNLN
jgi:hypothetical protein